MNLYLVTRRDTVEYDEYDSMVVAAKNEESAAHINPDDYRRQEGENWYYAWPEDTAVLKIVLLGTAVEGTQEGKILASFYAG
jgi:hypothetical protein